MGNILEAKLIDDSKVCVKDSDGKAKDFDVIFTFEDDDSGKTYVAYTDYTLDKAGNLLVKAVYYSDDKSKICPVESDEDNEIVKSVWDEIQSNVKEGGIENLLESLDEDELSHVQGEVKRVLDNMDTESWISLMNANIEKSKEEEFHLLLDLAEEINKKIFDTANRDKIEELYGLLRKIDAKLPSGCVIGSLGMEAYSKKKYELAEKAFKDSDSKNNLAYIIRRGEVKDSTEYSLKYVAELLKDGVHEKEPFSMINMALLWALNVKGEDNWKLADNIMSMVPRDNVSSALDWWLGVARNGDAEGYLVHYWMLKHNKIDKTLLGSKAELLDRIVSEINDIPDFMK